MTFIKCSYSKCKTKLPGVVVPVASFKALNAPKYMPPGHAIISDAMLCESCALTANIHELIDDKRWLEICRKIEGAGGTPPDRSSLELLLGSPKNQPLPQAFKKTITKLRKAQSNIRTKQ